MDIDQREIAVFKSLAQSGEGQIVYGYIQRLSDAMLAKVVDNKDSELVDLKAARLTRAVLAELSDRFIARGTLSEGVEIID